MTDIIWILLWGILILLGIIGCLVPIIPGPALSYAALFLLQIGLDKPFTNKFLLIWFAVIVAVTILDYIVPILGTKKMWWTKWGSRGATIGLFASIILLPILNITIGPFGLIGIIGCPFLWAYVGEKIHGKTKPLKATFGSFLGFLAGTILKLAVSIAIAVPFFRTSRHTIKNLF